MRLVTICLVLSMACGKGGEPPPPTSGSPNAQPESAPKVRPPGGNGTEDKALATYLSTCAVCHGQEGRADGQMAQTLNPRPRNYHDAKWQETVTDDQIKQIIQLGGKKMGKSEMMPGHPEYNDQLLDGLVGVIRGFGKQP
jgi:mono/diheme cytochrome c family protein